jgi:hypothetical protein
MNDLTHPQETTRTRYLLTKQKMGNTGNDYIGRAIATIDAFEKKLAALESQAVNNPRANYDEDTQTRQMSGGLIP